MKESVPPPPRARVGFTGGPCDIMADLPPLVLLLWRSLSSLGMGGARRWGFQDLGGLLCHPGPRKPLAVTSAGLHTFGGAGAAAELPFSRGPGLRRRNGTVHAGRCVE